MAKCELKYERALREQWEKSHEHVHKLEHEALNLALAELNRRLDEMNELRRQIDSERGRYPTRDYLDSVTSSIDTRLKLLENKGSNLDGRFWAMGAVVGAIVIAVNVIMHFVGGK